MSWVEKIQPNPTHYKWSNSTQPNWIGPSGGAKNIFPRGEVRFDNNFLALSLTLIIIQNNYLDTDV